MGDQRAKIVRGTIKRPRWISHDGPVLHHPPPSGGLENISARPINPKTKITHSPQFMPPSPFYVGNCTL
jgi:hypothetical protein